MSGKVKRKWHVVERNIVSAISTDKATGGPRSVRKGNVVGGALKDYLFFLTQEFQGSISKIQTCGKWFFWEPGMVPDHV